MSCPTLSVLLEETKEVVEWEELGIHLDIPKYELDKIRRQFFQEGVDRCRMEMIDFWLNSQENDPAWTTVINAVEKMRGLQEVVVHLKRKYLGEQPAKGDMLTAVDQNTTSSSPCIKIEKNIVKEFTNLEAKFAILLMEMKSGLMSISIPLTKLHDFIKTLLELRDLPKPGSLDDLFDSVWQYYDFLTVSLLDSIITQFLSNTSVLVTMQEYSKQLEDFKSCTKMEELVGVVACRHKGDGGSGSTELVVKLEGSWLGVTLRHFKMLVEEIMSEKGRYLSHMKVQKGCICVSWLIPCGLASVFTSIIQNRLDFVANVGIIKIEVADKQVFSKDDETIVSLSKLLFNAAKTHNIDVIQFLLSINVDPNVKHYSGKTSLIIAVESNRLSTADVSCVIIEILLQFGANIDEADNNGYTALVLALDLGRQKEVIKLLLEHDANPNIHPISLSCIRIAVEENDVEILTWLLEANADPDALNADGYTPLIFACSKGQLDAVNILLHHKANPNKYGEGGWSPLMMASEKDNFEIVESLISAGANVNYAIDNKHTALSIAVHHGSVKVVQVLLKSGANTEVCNPANWRIVHTASKLSDPTILLSLIEHGVDCSVATVSGITPLHIACTYNSEVAVEILLSAGVPVNVKEEDLGRTPLMQAVNIKNPNVVESLLSAGADVHVTDNYGNTALDMSLNESCHNEEITQLLLLRMGNTVDISHSVAQQEVMTFTNEPLPTISRDEYIPPTMSSDRSTMFMEDIKQAIENPLPPEGTVPKHPQNTNQQQQEPKQQQQH